MSANPSNFPYADLPDFSFGPEVAAKKRRRGIVTITVAAPAARPMPQISDYVIVCFNFNLDR